MIVDSMTPPEISDYLKKTIFSQGTTERIQDIYRRKRADYQKALKKWYRHHPGDEKYRIFRPVYLKSKTHETLTIIFYSDRPGCIYFVSYLTFWWRGRKYLALSPARHESRILFFSFHAFKRYAERYLGDPEAPLTDEFLGDIFIFNTQFLEQRYTYEGKETAALISTDGAWLYPPEESENPVIRTFISETEYFDGQRELDREAIESLKRYKKEVWDDTLDRPD